MEDNLKQDAQDFKTLVDIIEKFNEEKMDGSLQKLFIGTLVYKKVKIKVFTVNGTYVKRNHDMDFDEAGNWMAKKYIPEYEVWIDNNLQTVTYYHVLLHETTEAVDEMMEKGLQYEPAHDKSNAKEKIYIILKTKNILKL